jgi:hypothetical protein
MLAAVAAQATYTPATPELPPAANTPALALSSSALDFGAVTLGQAADRDLLLRNTGTVSLLVSSIETGGVFRVVSPAAPFSIAPGLSTGVTVRFTPTSTGAQSGVLTIVSNDPRNGRAAVTLSGTASGAAAAPLALSSSTLEFGNLAINTTRDAGVVIVNPTSGTVQLTTVLSNNPVFAVVNPTLPYSLAAGMNTPLIVRFAPTAVGPQSATLTIVTSAGQLTLAANGVATAGTAGARLLVSPLTLEFGNVPTSTSRDLTLSVTNPGTAPLEVTSAATGNTAFTVVSPAIPFLVTPGLVANMVVRFAPTTLGDQRGTLRIASSGGQAEVALSGAGAPLVVTPLFSDTFERESPSTCSLGAADNALGGNQEVYYFPLFRYPIADRIAPIGAEILRGAMRNPNFDYAGVQFSGAESNCMGSSASTFRQDFTIKMDVTLPPASDPDAVSQAGPFFRSRMHDLGAHIIGEQSAGFWLQLHSNGRLTLKRLATNETIASTGKPASFDGRRVHKLEVTVTGNTMQAALDSVLVQFDRGSTVTLPVETANQGGAGIAFSAEESRGAIGGQTVDNLVVTSPRPLP